MKVKSLYIAAQEINAGTLFVSMGMMEILKRNLHKVAFFRPIIYKTNIVDGDIEFILKHYNLDMKYEDTFGFDIAYVEDMIANNKTKQLLNELIIKFKKLEAEYDFVLCEGIRRSFLTTNINFDLNIEIAKHFASPYINIINAKNESAKEVTESIYLEHSNIEENGCSHFATFVNRLEKTKYDEVQKGIKNLDTTVFLLKEVEELNLISLKDVIESLGATEVLVQPQDYVRHLRATRVAALSLDNFLDKIEEDDLVIVPPDRSEIILGLLGALYSNALPSIGAIIFPFGMSMHPNIEKLIKGLEHFSIPILSVESDTYITAKKISKIHARIRLESERKIALSLGLFNQSVDIQSIEKKIASSKSDVMTPLMFEYKLFELARKEKRTIVLPESMDERILRAAEIILMRDVAKIVLLGNKDEVVQNAQRLGLDLSLAEILDFHNSPLVDEFATTFYEMRKHKGLTQEAAYDAMKSMNYFATMMVHLGYADGMVSGAVGSTGETILPALQIIKTTPDTNIVSSVFFMCMQTKVLVYGDCAVNQDPDAQALAQIALSSASTAQAFGIEAKVAMLSYSTGESGSGADVEKVREATKIAQEKSPQTLLEGPIQYDAAINKNVAKKKLPNSKVAGEASVFVFPDLNTGNNTYKAVQRSSGAVAIGPVLQGLNKPVNDLSRGCLVADIVNTVAITAIQAGM